jgi:hypothetical protein
MKKKSPLKGLVIRTAVVRRPDLGYIFAGDPAREAEDDPHTITFKWSAGAFNQGDRNYDAHTGCVIEKPEPGHLDASEPGYYSVITRTGMTSADILENSEPPPSKPRLGGIRSVSEIAGKAYAVGLGGMVYRLDRLDRWTRIDEGLPDTFDIQAAHGFDATDLYAVGHDGDLWHYNGKKWSKRELPTNVNLTEVHCAGDGRVYITGHHGVLIRGRGDAWEIIEQQETTEDLWDLAWFDGVLYISKFSTVYRLEKEGIVPVDFGGDPPKTACQLSAAKGVLWSIGDHDIMSYDGKNWTRIV